MKRGAGRPGWDRGSAWGRRPTLPDPGTPPRTVTSGAWDQRPHLLGEQLELQAGVLEGVGLPVVRLDHLPAPASVEVQVVGRLPVDGEPLLDPALEVPQREGRSPRVLGAAA